jgi:hypothetical protein
MISRRNFVIGSGIAALSPRTFATRAEPILNLSVMQSPRIKRAQERLLAEFERINSSIRTTLTVGPGRMTRPLDQFYLTGSAAPTLPIFWSTMGISDVASASPSTSSKNQR